MSENKVNLYQKILAVMQDVQYLQKDDTVAFGNTKYKAISEEKVTMAVRESLIKNKLVIFPVEQEHIKDGQLTTVNTKYKLVDVETGEFEIIPSSGTGVDTQDKGVGKAMTYAYKYLLLRTFAIPTGEDPDKVSSAEWDEKFKQEEQPKQKQQSGTTNKLPAIKGKWQILNGSMDGFDEFYQKQKEKGYADEQIDKFLAQKVVEKQKKEGAA